jgi:uncharacterized protein
MIADTITQKIGEAMKAHDKIRLSTLRMLSSALNYEFIAKQHKLSEEEELAVVRHEAKKRKEAVEALKVASGKPTFSTISAEDRINQEETELTILQEYLPAQMPDGEISKLVDEAIVATGAKSVADMGKVIGMVKAKSGGRAEGGKIAEIVKSKLML